MKYSPAKEISEEEARVGFRLIDGEVVLQKGDNKIVKQIDECGSPAYSLKIITRSGSLIDWWISPAIRSLMASSRERGSSSHVPTKTW